MKLQIRDRLKIKAAFCEGMHAQGRSQWVAGMPSATSGTWLVTPGATPK